MFIRGLVFSAMRARWKRRSGVALKYYEAVADSNIHACRFHAVEAMAHEMVRVLRRDA